MTSTLAARVSKGVMDLARRLFFGYVAVVVGPLAIAAAAFALRDLLARRRKSRSDGNGRAEAEALEHTVREVGVT